MVRSIGTEKHRKESDTMTTLEFTTDYTVEDWITENGPAFEEIESEFGIKLLNEDKYEIAYKMAAGQDFSNAMYHFFND